MKKKGSGKIMGYGKIKFRKEWRMNPVERIHSTKKGDKGYDRNKIKRDDMEDNDHDDFKETNE